MNEQVITTISAKVVTLEGVLYAAGVVTWHFIPNASQLYTKQEATGPPIIGNAPHVKQSNQRGTTSSKKEGAKTARTGATRRAARTAEAAKPPPVLQLTRGVTPSHKTEYLQSKRASTGTISARLTREQGG